MNTQFPFSTQGVQDWQDTIYAAGTTAIHAECTLIAQDFVDWISYRFSLSVEQVQFVTSLGALTHATYSASIQNTLQHRGTITLIKADQQAVSDKAQNPKVVYHENKNKVNSPNSISSELDDIDMEVSTTFRIEYLVAQ